MASGKLSPRQKMINLMYLVFIAMLALNMSKEVLGAFGLMNERLQDTNAKISNDNAAFLASLENKASENAAKYGPLYEQANQIKVLSEEYYSYIEGLKRSMLEEVKDPEDYQTMDKPDFLDQMFFEGDNLKPGGQEFLDKRIAYRDQVLAILGDDPKYQSLRESVMLRFETGGENGQVENRDGRKVDWLNYNYEGFPLIASLTKLSFTQSDIQNTEQEILKTMLEGQLTSEVAMTNYTTLLEQNKSAFYAGEDFDGSIVLGRKDATTRPNRVELTLDGKPLQENRDFVIEDGRVKLTISAGNPGDHKIEGNLVFLQDGEETRVPVNSTFATISMPNSAVISADKMNVVYRGVQNPLTISIPGVADNFVNASAPGLRKIGGSKYIMDPSNIRGREVTINASGKLPDGKMISTPKTFRIKDIPAPTGTIRGESGKVKMPRRNLEISTVGALLDDFVYDLDVKVSSFRISIQGQGTVQVNGTRMNSAAKSLIQRARPGDLIQIFDIKAYIANGSSYKLKPVSPVLVELTN